MSHNPGDIGSGHITARNRSTCQKGVLALDIYKQPIRLQLPDSSDRYRTFLGSMLSCMTVWLVSLYAVYKLHTLVNFGEY